MFIGGDLLNSLISSTKSIVKTNNEVNAGLKDMLMTGTNLSFSGADLSC